MRYRPLDMSFVKAKYSPQREDIRNTAQMILANAGWSQPSQVTLREISRAQKKANDASTHKQGFLGGFFDLLSTPLYTVANALDESLAGHQSDSDDSVIEDIAKSAGGVFTGAAKGFGAGLRGSTTMLDALPGVDINDDWQSSRQDKTHFSDVALRQNVGMSTSDAQKPENWEEVKSKLDKLNDKSVWDKTFSQLFIPDDLEAQGAREEYFRKNALAGIPSDIGADPLNFLMFGGKSAATAPRAIEEGLDAARVSTDPEAILRGLKTKNEAAPLSSGTPPPIGSLPEARPISLPDLPGVGRLDISESHPLMQVTPPPEGRSSWASIIRGGPRGVSETPNAPPTPFSTANEFEELGAVVSPSPANPIQESIGAAGSKADEFRGPIAPPKVPKVGLEVAAKDQKKLTADITNLAVTGEKNWLYKAADLMRRYPGVTWTETEKFLQHAENMVRAKGLKHNPGIGPALAARVSTDVANARKVEPAESVLNSATDIAIRPGVPRLAKSEAILANDIVRKFEGQIIGGKSAPGTGEGLVRAIASGANVGYSGPQQARLWNQITSSLKYSNPKKFDKAVRILRAVEDYFISKGKIPHSSAKTAESVPLRLSQVAEAIGPQVLGQSHSFITKVLRGDPDTLAKLSPEQLQAIELLKASESLATAPAVQKGIAIGKNLADEIVKVPRSSGRMKEEIAKVPAIVREETARAGGGDVGAKVAGEYVGNLLGRRDPINSALTSNRFKTEAWLSRDALGTTVKNDAAFAKTVTNAIAKAADLPHPATLGAASGAKARVRDWLGARFNAAYGVQDMRQIMLIEHSSAMNIAAKRAKLLNNLGREFDPKDVDLWHEAFRTAQANGIADGRIAELQSEIAKVMENLFGGTGLRSGAIADSTVVGRSRLLVSELNSNLKRFGLSQFQFTAGKKVKDATGVTHDFSKGSDWMKSWEIWDVKNPYEFLHKIQAAIQHTVHEKNMFDEIVARFASPKKHGNVKYAANHPRLAGYFFNAEGARQANQFVRILEEVSTPNSKALQHLDHVISKLKASLTIYVPGHHWTNVIGDTYFNWIAGVNKPIRYDQAVKVMLAQKGRYGDFATFGQLTSPDALKQAMARSLVSPNVGLKLPAAGNKTIITMQNGTKVTADMIYTAAMREGILPSARVLEEVGSEVSSVLDKFRPLGGRGQRVVHQVSEVRDHIPRLAQFVDGIAKSKGSFSTAISTSARSVRKWHPDGLDLTKFERDVMKRVFPFYSWTRKAIPLAIESAATAAPKVMAYPRLMEAIALSNGIESKAGTTDPFPTDQLFPDWLRARGIGPIAGGPGSYLSVNPSTPVLDIMTLLGQPGTSAIDMMNPLAKVPIETAQGQTLGRNVPIDDYGDYAAKQIPAISHIGRASGQFGVSDGTKEEGFPNWINIANMLTGLKMTDTGKYQKSGQFDLRDYLKAKSQQQGR